MKAGPMMPLGKVSILGSNGQGIATTQDAPEALKEDQEPICESGPLRWFAYEVKKANLLPPLFRNVFGHRVRFRPVVEIVQGVIVTPQNTQNAMGTGIVIDVGLDAQNYLYERGLDWQEAKANGHYLVTEFPQGGVASNWYRGESALTKQRVCYTNVQDLKSWDLFDKNGEPVELNWTEDRVFEKNEDGETISVYHRINWQGEKR